MRKKSRILPVLALAAILGGLSWLILCPSRPEPAFEGKPLSYWLWAYDAGNYRAIYGLTAPKADDADRAIKTMGTNALPTLLHMLRQRDSALKLKLIKLAQKQHFIKVKPVYPANQSLMAMSGFKALGAEAKTAVPQLMDLYDVNPQPCSRQVVPAILSEIGPDAKAAIPMLLRALSNMNDWERNNAVFALGQIHAQPALVVPELTKRLRDPANVVRASAAHALGEFGTNAQPAVPALMEMLESDRANQPVTPTPKTGFQFHFLAGCRIDFSPRGNSSTSSMPFPLSDVVRATETALQKIDPDAAAKAGVKYDSSSNR